MFLEWHLAHLSHHVKTLIISVSLVGSEVALTYASNGIPLTRYQIRPPNAVAKQDVHQKDAPVSRIVPRVLGVVTAKIPTMMVITVVNAVPMTVMTAKANKVGMKSPIMRTYASAVTMSYTKYLYGNHYVQYVFYNFVTFLY